MHLPPGPPCSTDRSLSGSKSISFAFSHSSPSPEHHIHMSGSAGQMPTSRAELLMMVFAHSRSLSDKHVFHLAYPVLAKCAQSSTCFNPFLAFCPALDLQEQLLLREAKGEVSLTRHHCITVCPTALGVQEWNSEESRT